jgi:serine/threonine-protein kinase
MEDITGPLQHALGDQYRLLRELGGGGMSRVFLAEEASLGRQVVVKVLPPELTSEASIARFKREAAVTAQLQHPNILPIIAFGARDGLLYYVSPFLTGETLRQRLERTGPLPVDEAVQLTREVAEALSVAHGRGVVHRDIKPENIFLSNGHAVLGDFGVARAMRSVGESPTHAGAQLTAVGQAVGTPAYMSPEQVAGDDTIDARSDIYSLGVVAYELLAGVPPFAGRSPQAAMAAHVSEVPRSVVDHRRDVPAFVSAAIARALAKNPDDRHANVADFRDALSISRSVRRRPARALLLAGALLCALLGAGAWYARSHSEAPALNDDLLAIAPFSVLDPDLEVWKEGIVDILSANLDDAGPIRTVPPTVVVRHWEGRADESSAMELAGEVGARYVVYGRFVGAGADSVSAVATLYDVAEHHALGEVRVRDASAHLDRVADSLTIGLLRSLGKTRPIAVVRRASIGSSSLPAIKAFLQAEQFYRRSEGDSAATYYEAAIAADSMFAPALRQLSNALGWTITTDSAELERRFHYALLAGVRNHGLAPRESLLVSADSNYAALWLRDGAAGDDPGPYAEQLFASLKEGVRRFPEDPEMWHTLADAHYHFLDFATDVTYADARREFDRSIALDSAFAPAYLHMPELALREQDAAAARRYVEQYLRLAPGKTAVGYMRAMQPLLDPTTTGSVDMDSLTAELSVSDAGTVSRILMQWMDSAESQVRFARSVRRLWTTRKDSAGAPPWVRPQLRVVLELRGHLREAAAMLDDDQFSSFLGPVLALLGAIPPDSADAMLLEAASKGGAGYGAGALRWWSARGDTARLESILIWSDTLKLPAGLEYLRSEMRASIEAHLALARRDTATALREMALVPDTACACLDLGLTKAQLLAAAGRDEDAMHILRQEYTGPDVVGVLWRYERAKVAERLGDRDRAVRNFAYVAAAFQHADSLLQPIVQYSRDALARLSDDAP